MKTLFILLSVFTFTTALVSCNTKPKSGKHLEKTQIISKKPNAEIDSITNVKVENDSVAITKLPFGSKFLVTSKFRDQWYANKKNDIDWEKLNGAKSFKGPEILKKNYVYVDEDSLTTEDRRQFQNDFKYRLPDMAIYECYYIYHDYGFQGDDKNTPILNQGRKRYIDLGSLVLYDRKNKSANIINIFYGFAYPEDEYEGQRYFYIGTNQTIRVLNSGGGEDGTSFLSAYEINVLKDGKIVVKNIK